MTEAIDPLSGVDHHQLEHLCDQRSLPNSHRPGVFSAAPLLYSSVLIVYLVEPVNSLTQALVVDTDTRPASPSARGSLRNCGRSLIQLHPKSNNSQPPTLLRGMTNAAHLPNPQIFTQYGTRCIGARYRCPIVVFPHGPLQPSRLVPTPPSSSASVGFWGDLVETSTSMIKSSGFFLSSSLKLQRVGAFSSLSPYTLLCGIIGGWF